MDETQTKKVAGWKEVIQGAKDCIDLAGQTDDISEVKERLDDAIAFLRTAKGIAGTGRPSFRNRERK